MEYILNVRSFFALLYKEVSVKYILRFPHHGNRSFAGVIDDTLSSYTGIMESAVRRSSLAHVVRLRILACRNDSSRKRIFSLQLTAHS